MSNYRQDATFNTSANYRPAVAWSFDQRQMVSAKAGLLDFTDDDYLPVGFAVLVQGPTDAERGWWILKDPAQKSNPSYSGWFQIGKPVQADWNQTTNTANDFIKNKPTKLSDFSDDLGHDANVQSDWNQTSSGADDFIKNKPTVITSTERAKLNWISVSQAVDLDTIEANVTTNNAKISNVQGDWNEGSSSAQDFIKNKPTNLSDFTNDIDTITAGERAKLAWISITQAVNLDTIESNVTTNNAKRSYPLADENKLDGIEAGAEVNVQADWNVTSSTSDAFIKNKPTSFNPAAHTHPWSQVTDKPSFFDGNYNSLTNKPVANNWLSTDSNNSIVLGTDNKLYYQNQPQTITTPITANVECGSVFVGQTIQVGTTLQQLAELLLLETYNPTYSAFRRFNTQWTGASIYEVGESVTNEQLSVSYSRVQITGATVAGTDQNGDPINYWDVTSTAQGYLTGALGGAGGSISFTNMPTDANSTGNSTSFTLSNFTISHGMQNVGTIDASVGAGSQALDSSGAQHAAPATDSMASPVTYAVEGAYPIYGTTLNIGALNKPATSNEGLYSNITGNGLDGANWIRIDLVAEVQGGAKQRLAIPDVNTGIASLQIDETGNGDWKTISVSTFGYIGDTTIGGVTYKEYEHNGTDRGSVKLRLKVTP